MKHKFKRQTQMLWQNAQIFWKIIKRKRTLIEKIDRYRAHKPQLFKIMNSGEETVGKFCAE